MKANQLFHAAGWSACVNVVANIMGFVSPFVFFAVGGLVSFLGILIWAIWLGRILLAGSLISR
jgi:hypothetical protein